MEEGMMMMSGTHVLGFPLEVFLMYVSGIFYLLCAAFLWKPYREEKNELIGALFAFLVYQSISMYFMGLEMNSMNMLFGNIASLAVLIGSTYMLKFVFSSFRAATRRNLFIASLIVVVGVFIWFIQTPEREMILMNFTLWYDIIINGVIVGGAIILFGLKSSERWLRIKALGGGGGIVSCCVVSNATMLGGAFLVSSVFQFLAPVLILGSLFVARKNQKMNAMNSGLDSNTGAPLTPDVTPQAN